MGDGWVVGGWWVLYSDGANGGGAQRAAACACVEVVVEVGGHRTASVDAE